METPARPKWAEPGVAKLRELFRAAMQLPPDQHVYVGDRYFNEREGYVMITLGGENSRPASLNMRIPCFDYARMSDWLVLAAAEHVVLAWVDDEEREEWEKTEERKHAAGVFNAALHMRCTPVHPYYGPFVERRKSGPRKEFRLVSTVKIALGGSDAEMHDRVRDAFVRKFAGRAIVFEEVGNKDGKPQMQTKVGRSRRRKA